MCDQEKQIAETLVGAFNSLPDTKKEYLLGFAEGVAAATDQQKDADQQKA